MQHVLASYLVYLLKIIQHSCVCSIFTHTFDFSDVHGTPFINWHHLSEMIVHPDLPWNSRCTNCTIYTNTCNIQPPKATHIGGLSKNAGPVCLHVRTFQYVVSPYCTYITDLYNAFYFAAPLSLFTRMFFYHSLTSFTLHYTTPDKFTVTTWHICDNLCIVPSSTT